MKNKSYLGFSALTLGLALVCSASFANAGAMPQTYQLTVTNGSAMPVSPAVVYVKQGRAALTMVGQSATAGFTHLCQTGSPDQRLSEVQGSAGVQSVQKTSGLLMPGQSIKVSVTVSEGESLQFEAMYGKTKDTCAVFSVGADELAKIARGDGFFGRDEVLTTGMFTDPALPQGLSGVCVAATSAVDCLRELATPATGGTTVRFFPGYLPTVLNYLEGRFGAMDTGTLVIPTSGAVRFQVMRM